MRRHVLLCLSPFSAGGNRVTLDSDKNFGVVIAFVLPGFVCLWGASCWSSTVAGWLSVVPTANATVGGFLYASLGSLAAGLTASAVRWAIVDTIHHRTGVRPPEWDFGKLQDKLEAFDALVENHYRYYQFYANMLVAVAFASGCDVFSGTKDAVLSAWAIVGLVFIQSVFFAGSRDALRKYYSRAERLLGTLTLQERSDHHDERLPSTERTARQEDFEGACDD